MSATQFLVLGSVVIVVVMILSFPFVLKFAKWLADQDPEVKKIKKEIEETEQQLREIDAEMRDLKNKMGLRRR